MPKVNFYFSVFMFITNIATSQTDTTTAVFPDYAKILSVQFSKVITGNSFSNLGNYAAVTSTSESLKASVNFLRKNGDMIAITASGGAVDGVSAYFKDGKINSKIEGRVTYHRLCKSDLTKIAWDSFELDKLREERKKIISDYALAKIKIKFKKDGIDAQAAYNKLLAQNIKADTLRKKTNALRAGASAEKLKQLQFTLDSLDAEKELFNFERLALSKKLESIDTAYFDEQTLKAGQKKDADLLANDKKLLAVPIEQINVRWFSIGYGIKNEEFNLFDPLMAFNKQVFLENYTTHELNIAYSQYKWKSWNPGDSQFLSFGSSVKYTNNLASLDKVEVVDKQVISTDPLREVNATQTAYSGIYLQNLKAIALFCDYYKFFGFGENSSIALHLNPKYVIKDDTKPTANIQTGILIPLRKTEEQASFVNLEIFYSFNDLFNTSESNHSLVSRNIIGLQATFPITFLFTKN